MSAKYEQLASILRSECHQLYRDGVTKLPTESEISARYHMSRQTVRHALQILEDEGLVERRQGSGSYIHAPDSSGDPRQIAVITTFLDDYIFPSILHDVQSSFSLAGYSTLIFATDSKVGQEREILTHLLGRKISGVLVEGSKTSLPTPNADLYQKLRSNGTPVLFLHGIYSNLQDFPCLLDDNYNGGYQLAQYLLAKGHSNIAGVFKSDDVQGPQRYLGVVSALRDKGLPIVDDRFFWYDTEDRAAIVNSQGNSVLSYFVRNCLGDATAAICYNDEIAHFLIQQLLDNGYSVPGDVAVASFDNSFYSRIGPVSITSLGHKTQKTGKAAAAMLLDILSGGKVLPRTLEWELNCRDST